jgi:hypothetical protein
MEGVPKVPDCGRLQSAQAGNLGGRMDLLGAEEGRGCFLRERLTGMDVGPA